MMKKLVSDLITVIIDNISSVILILIILFSIGINITSIRSCSNQQRINENNILAMTDSISYYKLKNGELVATKTILEGDLNTLKLANDSLYKVIKDMKLKDPTKIVYITTETVLEKRDTIWMSDSIIVSYEIRKPFDFTNKYQSLTGSVWVKEKQLGLNIDKNIVYADYTVAFEDNKVYIKSSNPYVHYTNVTGIQIPKPKEKIEFGVFGNAQYEFKYKKVSPFVGVDLSYKGFSGFYEYELLDNNHIIGLGYKYTLIKF